MTDQNTRTDHKPVWMAERTIVLQVLRDDHPERWSRAELEEQTSDLDPLTVSDALARLAEEGVVILDRGERRGVTMRAAHGPP